MEKEVNLFNPALITKCITGTEQDFIMLMNRAGDYLARHHPDLSEEYALNHCTDRKGVDAKSWLRVLRLRSR